MNIQKFMTIYKIECFLIEPTCEICYHCKKNYSKFSFEGCDNITVINRNYGKRLPHIFLMIFKWQADTLFWNMKEFYFFSLLLPERSWLEERPQSNCALVSSDHTCAWIVLFLSLVMLRHYIPHDSFQTLYYSVNHYKIWQTHSETIISFKFWYLCQEEP